MCSSVWNVGAQLPRRRPRSQGPCQGKGHGPGWRCSPSCQNPPTSSSRCGKSAPERGAEFRASGFLANIFLGALSECFRLYSTHGGNINWPGRRCNPAFKLTLRANASVLMLFLYSTKNKEPLERRPLWNSPWKILIEQMHVHISGRLQLKPSLLDTPVILDRNTIWIQKHNVKLNLESSEDLLLQHHKRGKSFSFLADPLL